MKEILYTGLIASDKMSQVVDQCHFTRDALFLAEQLPTTIIKSKKERLNLLKFTSIEDSPPCIEYSTGRIFQHDRELRWERQRNEVRIIYLGPAEDNVNLQEDRIRENPVLETLVKQSEPAYYYLFGERLRPADLEKLSQVAQPGDFAVLRIPRILRYPVPQDDKRYVRLVVCNYREKATDRVALFRFQRLETVEVERNESI
jgi:hypothetical protein